MLTGCGDDGPEVGVGLRCGGGNIGSISCDRAEVTVRIPFGRSADFGMAYVLRSGFDISQVDVDFSLSSSNVSVTTNSGYGTIRLTLDGGTVLANSFPWVRQGDRIVAQNPSAVNNWVNSYIHDIVDVDIDLGPISATGGNGANTLVMETTYSGTVLAGTTHSWYYGGGSCDPDIVTCLPPN